MSLKVRILLSPRKVMSSIETKLCVKCVFINYVRCKKKCHKEEDTVSFKICLRIQKFFKFYSFYHLEHVCVQNLKLCSQNLFSKGKNDFINTSCSYDVIKLTKSGIFIIVLLCKCVHRRRPKQQHIL